MPEALLDVYERSTQLADDLAKSGESESSDSIRDAMLAGSTGTEILMELRFQLRNLRFAPESEFVRRARQIAIEIDRLLR